MTVQPISLPAGVYYMDLSVRLGKLDYILTLRFNGRMDAWTCDIKDSTGMTLVAGIALRQGRNVLDGYYAKPSIPRGVLFVYDMTGEEKDPGKDSFSSTHKLVFVRN